MSAAGMQAFAPAVAQTSSSMKPCCGAGVQVVGVWREDLKRVNPKAAESLADPSQYANLFPDMDAALQAESLQVRQPHHPAPLIADELGAS